MDEMIISMDKTEVEVTAKNYFLCSSGLTKNGPKFDKMREEAFKTHDLLQKRINIKAISSFNQDINLQDNLLRVRKKEFRCNAFAQIDHNSIHGVYLYIVTAGDFFLEHEGILRQVFADIWGTSYIDAARNLLEQRLLHDYHEKYGDKQELQNKKYFLSNSFGPGFYGMKLDQIQDIISVVDEEKIQVCVKENSNLMTPLKSCAGIYFVVDDNYKMIGKECEKCMGNAYGCKLCNRFQCKRTEVSNTKTSNEGVTNESHQS